MLESYHLLPPICGTFAVAVFANIDSRAQVQSTFSAPTCSYGATTFMPFLCSPIYLFYASLGGLFQDQNVRHHPKGFNLLEPK